MINQRRLWALCRKETYQILRDPSCILIAFILPIVLLFIFGYGLNLDTGTVRLGVVLEDQGAEAQQFISTLQGSPYINIQIGHNTTAMNKQLVKAQLDGIVIIPSDFSKKVHQNKATITLLTDGSIPNTASFSAKFVHGAWQKWMQYRQPPSSQAAPTLKIESRYWFNPDAVSRNFLVPGSISVIMTIIGALLTSLTIAREWERGTMEALLSTPATRAELLLSKIIPYYILGMTAMTICVLMSTFIMGVPFRGSIFALFIVSSLFLGSSLGLGLFLSAVTRNQFFAAQMALLSAFLPATMLSGFVFEINSMPYWIRLLTYIVPARYFVSALQSLFQAGDIWSLLWVDVAFLLLCALLWLGLTALKLKRRLY